MSEIEKEASALESAEKKPGGETRKLEPGAKAPEPRPRRAETKKLEAEPEAALEVAASPPRLGLTREEMNWAALAHASILVTLLLGLSSGGLAVILGPIIPAIIWYVYREKSEYVMEQARLATIFQLAGIVVQLTLAIVGAVLITVGWTVSVVLIIVLIGLILMPVMLLLTLLWVVVIVALPIAQVVYGCYAALETYHGRPFRYLWISDLIDRYQAQA